MKPSEVHQLEFAEQRLGLRSYLPKKLRRKALIFAVGLIAVWAVWWYSVFDPAQAAWKGHYFVVAAYVRFDPGIVNRQIDGEWTLLYAASSGDHPEIVKYLLESGADPNLPIGGSACGPTPVHAAAYHGSAESLKLLIEAGADFDGRKNCDDEPPILEAAWQGHVEVVKILLDAGVDPNTNAWRRSQHDPELEHGFTTLEQAAIHGHADVVKLLLERGAKVQDFKNDFHDTALHTFCSITPDPKHEVEGYETWVAAIPTIVDLLVNELGDVNFGDGFGNTPLHEAADNQTSSSVDIIRYLVESYPELDVNAKDSWGETPLHKAMNYYRKLHSLKFLVENRPDLDVNATDDRGRTPLHVGATFGNAVGVRFLLENCPTLNVNATNKWGYTPLSIAKHELWDAKRENDQKKSEALQEITKLLEAHGGRIDKEAIQRAISGPR